MDFEQELIKFKLLIGIEQIENNEFDADLFKTETKEIFQENIGDNVIPLFLA